MKNVGISTGHCGFTDTFSNNIINDLQSSFTLLCFFMRRFCPIEYGIYIMDRGGAYGKYQVFILQRNKR